MVYEKEERKIEDGFWGESIFKEKEEEEESPRKLNKWRERYMKFERGVPLRQT